MDDDEDEEEVAELVMTGDLVVLFDFEFTTVSTVEEDLEEFGDGVLEWISLIDWDGETRLAKPGDIFSFTVNFRENFSLAFFDYKSWAN